MRPDLRFMLAALFTHMWGAPAPPALQDYLWLCKGILCAQWPSTKISAPTYDGDNAEASYNAFIADWAINNTANLLDLIGQSSGAWSTPTCDQDLDY